jgi:hypothetical protein
VAFTLEHVEQHMGNDPSKPLEPWFLYTILQAPPDRTDDLEFFNGQFRVPRWQCTDLLIQLLEKMGYSLWTPQDDGQEDDESAGDGDEVQIQGEMSLKAYSLFDGTSYILCCQNVDID